MGRLPVRLALLVCLVAPGIAAGSNPRVKIDTAGFERTVLPLLNRSCAGCHNERVMSGSLNLTPFAYPESLHERRDEWERVIQKVRSGEMPPKGVPRPAQPQVDALIAYLTGEFEKVDRATPPDPGRVTARRLNRNEYSNTIRDLLGVDFRADRDFPTDDSGEGFDNIADVLTISPVLMEKYAEAAERIAARAIGADPLPDKPLEFEYHLRERKVRRVDASTIEAVHRVDWDGEYIVRIGLPGERGKDAAPVTLGFWMDGKLLHTVPVETKPSGLAYFNPYSEADMRLVLPEGDHVFRAGFIDDAYVATLDEKDVYNDKKNKFLNMIKFIGPFPVKGEKASRKKILICDPASGRACVERIIATLAQRAWRRPVSRAEVASLLRFVDLARKEGQSTEQGVQLAIQAMLMSPHFLFRIERDPAPTDPSKVHRISDIELASRLSYFLWNSMPDDLLLDLAEAGKLSQPQVLDAQVKRMLEDPRSSTLARNFAGQWLEIRNLAVVKPDPQKFPEWSPELADAMRTETEMFFEAMLRENRPIGDFLDARFTFLNERLAKHYGIEGVKGAEFRRVELTSEERGGILSHASVLTVSSYPTRTSPVIRGKYILMNILGSPPPPPPPDVPALDEAAVGSLGSLRQKLEQHRTNAVCASCHNRMDVLGFGLENYDAIGRWRTRDGKFDIDAGGTLPNGKSFETPAQLRRLLKEDLPEVVRCLTEKMMTYALGRGVERYDRPTINAIVRKLEADNYRFQPLIYEIVRSLPFTMRRGEKVSSETKIREVARQ